MLLSISFAPPVPEKLLSAAYVTMNHENVRRHMEPLSGFQNNVTLRDLTVGIIRDWISWAADNRLSGRLSTWSCRHEDTRPICRYEGRDSA
jgi:hypothetical protein